MTEIANLARRAVVVGVDGCGGSEAAIEAAAVVHDTSGEVGGW